MPCINCSLTHSHTNAGIHLWHRECIDSWPRGAGRLCQFLAGAGPVSCLKGTAVRECEVQNAAAVVSLELRPLECFPSVAAHINFTRCPLLPLAFVRKHVSKSPHGCSFNKTAKVLHFTGYMFVLYRCCCEGNVLLYCRVPALNSAPTKATI